MQQLDVQLTRALGDREPQRPLNVVALHNPRYGHTDERGGRERVDYLCV